MDNWVYYIIAAILSGGITSLVVPLLVFSAHKNRLFDKPNERKVHTGASIPRISGLSFAPAILMSMCLIFSAAIYFSNDNVFWERGESIKTLLFVTGLLAIYTVGIIDDTMGVSATHKFIVHFLAAFLIVLPFNYISDFEGILLIHKIPDIFGVLFTTIVVVLIINAYNLIDGIDGLCSGLGITFCGLFIFTRLAQNITIINIIAIALGSALIPFFYFNVYGKKFKTFMGDTGSYTVGFVIAYIFTRLSSRPEIDPIGILVGASLLFVPVFDTIRVFTGRILKKQSPFTPDKTHLHHIFLACGFSHIKATLSIIGMQVFITGMDYFMNQWEFNVNIILIADCIFFMAVYFGLICLKKKKEKI